MKHKKESKPEEEEAEGEAISEGDENETVKSNWAKEPLKVADTTSAGEPYIIIRSLEPLF